MQKLDALEFWQAQTPEYFRELSTFGAIPDDVILRMLEDGSVLKLDPEEPLYDVGERSESFYIVLSGCMNTYMPGEAGSWTLARIHNPGDDMGFVPMIALTDRPAKTVADIESIVLEITSLQFFDLHQQEPEAFGLMLLNLVRGMARAIINMATMLEQQDRQLHRAYSAKPEDTHGPL